MRKAPPLSLSVKRRRWQFTFFFPVSSLVEHGLFSSLSLRGMTELYLIAGRSRQKKRRDNALHFHSLQVTPPPLPALEVRVCNQPHPL